MSKSVNPKNGDEELMKFSTSMSLGPDGLFPKSRKFLFPLFSFLIPAAIMAVGLMILGVPTVTFSLADNQLMLAEGFSERGLMLNAGDCREDGAFIDGLIKNIGKLIGDRDARKETSALMQRTVDGYGARRLAEEILK